MKQTPEVVKTKRTRTWGAVEKGAWICAEWAVSTNALYESLKELIKYYIFKSKENIWSWFMGVSILPWKRLFGSLCHGQTHTR